MTDDLRAFRFVMEVGGCCVSRYLNDGPGGMAGEPVQYLACEVESSRAALERATGCEVEAVALSVYEPESEEQECPEE